MYTRIIWIFIFRMVSKMAEEGCSHEEITRYIQETVKAMKNGNYLPTEISERVIWNIMDYIV